MKNEESPAQKDTNLIAEAAAGAGVFAVTKGILEHKTDKTTLEKLMQVGESLGLKIETLDDAARIFKEAREQKNLLELKKQKIIFLNEEDRFFKKRATEIYCGLRDAGIDNSSKKELNTGVAVAAAIVAGIAVMGAKKLFFGESSPSTKVAADNSVLDKRISDPSAHIANIS